LEHNTIKVYYFILLVLMKNLHMIY